MIARIIKAEVCVICRSRRLRPITQTEALIILAIMRKPNPIIVLLCIYLSNCKDKSVHGHCTAHQIVIEVYCMYKFLQVYCMLTLQLKKLKFLRNLRTRVVYDYFFLRKAKNGRLLVWIHN